MCVFSTLRWNSTKLYALLREIHFVTARFYRKQVLPMFGAIFI